MIKKILKIKNKKNESIFGIKFVFGNSHNFISLNIYFYLSKLSEIVPKHLFYLVFEIINIINLIIEKYNLLY